MYQIQELARMSGLTTRTLRYYDEIGLLEPCAINESGYRMYSRREVDRLQQILFYKKMDIKLNQIRDILDNPDYDLLNALQQQKQYLLNQQLELQRLLDTVERTIQLHKGEIHMTNEEKFEAFKKKTLEENEAKFGEEIREKYGEDAVEASNQQWMNITEEQFEAAAGYEDQLIGALNYLLDHNIEGLDNEHAKAAFEAHKSWLQVMAPQYSGEFHKNLAEMYVADERFASYYNERTNKDSVQLLKSIIDYYA